MNHPTFLRSPFLIAAAAAVLAVSCLPSSIASDEVVASTLRKPQRFAGRTTQRMLDEDLLDRVGNNGSPSANYPLKACQGDCDNDDECMVSDMYCNCSSSCILLISSFFILLSFLSISLYYLIIFSRRVWFAFKGMTGTWMDVSLAVQELQRVKMITV